MTEESNNIQVTPPNPARVKNKSEVPGIANYYVGMVVDILLLYFLNNVKYLNLSILNNDKFTSCLWAINLALTAGILGNFFLLIYRPRWFYHLVQVILNLLVILGFYIIFANMPFNFDREIYNTIVKVALIVVMAATGVAVVFELVKFANIMLHPEARTTQAAVSAAPVLQTVSSDPGLPSATEGTIEHTTPDCENAEPPQSIDPPPQSESK